MERIVVHPACHSASGAPPIQLDLYVSGPRALLSCDCGLAAEELLDDIFEGNTALRALVHTRSVLHPTLAPPGTFATVKRCEPID